MTDVGAERWGPTTGVFTLAIGAVSAGAGEPTMRVRVALRTDATVVGTPTTTLEGAGATEER